MPWRTVPRTAGLPGASISSGFPTESLQFEMPGFVVNGRRVGIGRHRIHYPAVPRLTPLACPMHFPENNVTDCATAE